MKLTIFLPILILLLPVTLAETKIFSGNIVTGTDKVIDGGTFRFTYDEQSNKAFVQTPSTGLIVENGACKSNNIFRVCINRANFSYKNITTYVYYYELNVDIYKLTGSLSASSKSTLSSLLQGESTELIITITNPTDFEITNILLNYEINNFTLNGVKGCTLDGNKITWQGSLQSKYDTICTVTIITEKEGKYSLSGNLRYFNGFETENKTTDILAITVLPRQLKVSQFIDKDIEVKKPFYFNISLWNIHTSENINSIATITIPSHASLIKDAPSFEKSAKVLKHSLTLKPGTSINYSLYMEKLSEGKVPINLRFAYTIKGINDVIENNTFIDIVSTQPVNKSLEPKIEEKKSNETVNLTATEANSQAISENKTNETKLESSNRTTEQVTLISTQSKPFNKLLLLIIAILIVFIIVILIIFKVRKRKKETTTLEKEIVRVKEQAATQEIEKIKPVPKLEKEEEVETKEIQSKKPRKQKKLAKKNIKKPSAKPKTKDF